MQADIHASASDELHRPRLIKENERTNHLTSGVWQPTVHGKTTAQIAHARNNNHVERSTSPFIAGYRFLRASSSSHSPVFAVEAQSAAWNGRSLADEPIVRLIFDGTVVRVRLDRHATSISLLVVLGVRQDGQKVLLAVKNMGAESEAAWRALLDDLVKRGLRTPELVS